MNKMLKYSLFLAALCAISGLLLSFINSLTAPIIEENKQIKLRTELEEQFPYDYYMRVDDAANDTKSNTIQAYFYAFNDKKELEAVIYRTSFQGYKSQIICLISIKADGTIENVKMIAGKDTYDAEMRKHDFEIAGEPVDDYNYTVKSGVTITSDAIGLGIDTAVSHFKTIRDSLGGVRYE
ncbi:MAG: hypothetical protein PHT03_03270 [Bacilli bacterium]|nr:hypothetical protein [Bacilli bacterium]